MGLDFRDVGDEFTGNDANLVRLGVALEGYCDDEPGDEEFGEVGEAADEAGDVEVVRRGLTDEETIIRDYLRRVGEVPGVVLEHC